MQQKMSVCLGFLALVVLSASRAVEGSVSVVQGEDDKATWNSRRLIVFSKTDADEEADWPALGLPYVYVFRTSGVNADRSVGVVEIISDDVTAEEGREFLLGTGVFEDVCLDYVFKADHNRMIMDAHRRSELSNAESPQNDILALKESFRSARPETPNDPGWSYQWNARQARFDYTWSLDIVGADVVVAVVDSGCQVDHPDLAPSLWSNEAELHGEDGVDDDGNGFVDDKHGFNFIDNNGDVSDENGHGTHVAGIIGAAKDNSAGIAGLVSNIQIMCLKFMGADGSGFQSDAIQAIGYAALMKANIQNHSWGGKGVAKGLVRAVGIAGGLGHLFVTAAGNDGENLDYAQNMMPAGLSRADVYPEVAPFVISVAATNGADELTYFSNYGKDSIDIAAPGLNILSLNNDIGETGGVQVYSGTSMAAPHVTAAAAMVLSVLSATRNRNSMDTVTPSAVKEVLIMSVDKISSLTAYTKAGGRLNAFSAVQYAATGDLSATILVEDPITEVPEWGAALLALLSFLTLVLIAVMTLVLAQAALAYTPPDVVDNRQGNLL